jgi:glucokinase
MSDTGKNTVLAIDAGGTYFKSALVDNAGGIIEGSFFADPVNSQGGKEEITAVYGLIIRRALGLAESSGARLTGVGVSTPGPFDYAAGMSLMTHKFQCLKGVPLREELRRLGGLSAETQVVFTQDVRAFLAGELWTGAAKGVECSAAVTLGTGLGFGVVKDSKVLDNGKGGPPVSIFNRPYKNGILEDAVSARGISARYKSLSGVSAAPREIAERAAKGDAHAIKVFLETGETLASELAGLLAEFGAKRLIFGGQISKAFGFIGPAFQERTRLSGAEIQAVPAKNIELSALIGAAREVGILSSRCLHLRA